MRLVLLGDLACEQEQTVRAKLTLPIEVVPAPGSAPTAMVRDALADAGAAITMRYDRTMPPAPKLELLQVGGTGWDDIDLTYLPPGAVVCNAYGHETAVAEYVLLAMLLWVSRFLDAERSFRGGSWALGGRTGGPLAEELGGKTVGLIGYGHIGREVARRARAFDARVIACTRRPPRSADGLDWIGDLGIVDRLLGESDFVVIAAGLGPETKGLIDERRFRLMRPRGVLINVSRGAIVDEAALYAAARDRTIAGAVIDTWYRYPTASDPAPRPSQFPFHELPNVLMTPHSSAWTTGMIERRWSTIVANVERVASGQPPVNVVYRVPSERPG
jgi:phosphoglycerate dehydrogenase-like enzyme